jgi:phosphate transport system substrate-binding protein
MASGVVIQPGAATFKAAAAGVDWSKTFSQILTNEPGKDAWPVVGATFVLLHAAQDNADRRDETLKFFDWAFTNGKRAAEDLDYIPLPESAVTGIRAKWRDKTKATVRRSAPDDSE